MKIYSKKKLILSCVLTLLMIFALVATSYSFLSTRKTSEKTQILKTGDLLISLGNAGVDGRINLTNSTPMNDKQALAIIDPVTVRVVNVSNYQVGFKVVLESTNEDDWLNSDMINVSYFQTGKTPVTNTLKNYKSYCVEGDSSLDDCQGQKGKTIISGTILGNTVEDFNIYLYLNEKADNTYQNQTFTTNIKVYLTEEQYPTDLACFNINDDIVVGYNEACSKNVIIPDKNSEGETITEIGENAFLDKKIESVIIPSSITTIRENAFKGNALKEVNISSDINLIEKNAFVDNKDLEFIINESNLNADWSSILGFNASKTLNRSGIYSYNEQMVSVLTKPDNSCFTFNQETKTLSNYTCKEHYIVLPGVYNGQIVENIDIMNENNETEIYSLYFKEGLVKINSNAFKSKIRTIKLPETLEVIESDAFSYMELESSNPLRIPSNVTYIGHKAFNILPRDYKIINDSKRAFDFVYITKMNVNNQEYQLGCDNTNCYKVKDAYSNAYVNSYKNYIGNLELEIQDSNNRKSSILITETRSINNIDKTCFKIDLDGNLTSYNSECEKEVILPSNVKRLINISNVDSLIIPSSTVAIGSEEKIEAITSCDNLTVLEIPVSVTDIYDNALSSCPNLTTIYNSTGRAFDWNKIINNETSETYSKSTSLYNSSGNLVTIYDTFGKNILY